MRLKDPDQLVWSVEHLYSYFHYRFLFICCTEKFFLFIPKFGLGLVNSIFAHFLRSMICLFSVSHICLSIYINKNFNRNQCLCYAVILPRLVCAKNISGNVFHLNSVCIVTYFGMFCVLLNNYPVLIWSYLSHSPFRYRLSNKKLNSPGARGCFSHDVLTMKFSSLLFLGQPNIKKSQHVNVSSKRFKPSLPSMLWSDTQQQVAHCPS